MEHIGGIQMTVDNNMTLRLITNDNNCKVCAETAIQVILVVSRPCTHDQILRKRVNLP